MQSTRRAPIEQTAQDIGMEARYGSTEDSAFETINKLRNVAYPENFAVWYDRQEGRYFADRWSLAGAYKGRRFQYIDRGHIILDEFEGGPSI